MKKEKVVFVLIGQRGSGKSSYGTRLIKDQPELIPISRDEILVRRFGSVHTSPYSGSNQHVHVVIHRLLRRKLCTQTGISILLDTWTENSQQRKLLVKKLREYGANRIVALYFITPLEVVETWFWKKPGIAKMSEMSTRQGQGLSFFSENASARDYELFHKLASEINSDGFDKVVRIDPREKLIILS